MEFNVDENRTTDAVRVLKINNTISVEGYKKSHDLQKKIASIIDEVGKMSAIAQDLELPITTTNKFKNSDQIIYVMTEQNTPDHFVVGMLRMGWKQLHLYDKCGSRSETNVYHFYCLYDFYIHESRRRKGYGKQLMDYMLQDRNLDVKNLAIDKPSTKFLKFMWKHYQLSELIYQGKNIVIYNDFFNNGPKENYFNHSEIRLSAYNNHQPSFGPFKAYTHYDTMGKIISPHSAENQIEFPINMDGHFVERNHYILYNSLSL